MQIAYLLSERILHEVAGGWFNLVHLIVILVRPTLVYIAERKNVCVSEGHER